MGVSYCWGYYVPYWDFSRGLVMVSIETAFIFFIGVILAAGVISLAAFSFAKIILFVTGLK